MLRDRCVTWFVVSVGACMSESLFTESHASAAPPQEGKPLDQLLRQYWQLFRRYFWILLVTSALVTTAAYFWTQRQPRIYSASSKIIFHTSQSGVFGKNIERVDLLDAGSSWMFTQFWNTQREVLRSREFALRIVERGDLLNNPNFSSAPAEASAPAPSQDQRRLKVATRLLSMTTVELLPDSRVAMVTVRVSDPKLAAQLATLYAKTYVEYTREFQTGGLNQMIQWFDSYVQGKRGELDAAQRKLHQFKRDNAILSISFESRQNLTSSNLTSINDQLNLLETKLATEESLLRQIEQMERGGEDMRVLAEMVSAATLSEALAREALLREKLAQVKGNGYLDGVREVKAVAEELRVVQENIRADIDRIKVGIKGRAGTLRRERDRLKGELSKLTEAAMRLDELGIEYNTMRDSADSLRQLYESVLKRSEELDINSMYESQNIQVLEEATVPGGPISPNLPLNLLIGLALGLGLGAAIIVLIDAMDNTVKREEHITRYTERPILGLLPRVNSSVLKNLPTVGKLNPVDTITHIAPRSAFAEGIKALRTNLMFIAPDQPPQVLMVTSPGPGEGKTMTSANMAIAMAQSGLKVLLIDADMRRPRVHTVFGDDNAKGLSDLLKGELTLEEVLNSSDVEGLSYITSGPIPPNPSELLHHPTCKALIATLRERYDRIIFDSPPVGAVSDPLVLSRSVDGALLILMMGKTRREQLRRALEQLVTVGAPLMGCVLNNIDSSNSEYAYSYYRYGYEERGS